MHLLIVESPAKAKTINKYLGKDFQVLASFGHIRDLPSKDGSVRPDEDFAMDYQISPDSTKHVKAITDAVKNADSIYLATDPDREGEAISWHIIEAMRQKKALKKDLPIHRVVFHEITKKAVTTAVANPRDIDMNLVNAQQARRALDYLVGFTLSPVLWRKLPGSKSAGRVQSVALRLICEREAEIEVFVAQEYWDIALHCQNQKNQPFKAKLTVFDQEKLEKFTISNEKQANTMAEAIAKNSFKVAKIEKKQARRNPYAPFTTSSLQQEASRKLFFGTKKTMQVAQKLYEGIALDGETVGLITYMRTDAVTVSQEAIDGTRKMIEEVYGKKYLPDAPRSYKTKAKNTQEAHEAIRPTDVTRRPEDLKAFLDKDQLALYTLIWKRMVASQMESVVLDQVRADLTNEKGDIVARANGSTIAFDGFYCLYQEGKDDESEEDDDNPRLPPLEEGETIAVDKVEPAQHFTQPPPRYSEASLVKKLEELGIGRPSTYASIISVLQDRKYVVLDKRRFIAEPRGRVVTSFLTEFFPKYVEYDFTANLEDELDTVSHGKLDWKALLKQFWGDFYAKTEEVKTFQQSDVIRALNVALADYLFPKDEHGNPNRKCPSCDDGKLSLKLGRYGAFLGCSNYPDCKHTRQLDGEEGEEGAQDIQDRMLGQDPETGLDVLVKKGPYGFYIQLGEPAEKGEKPKRMSLPKNHDPMTISFEDALALISLPREVGIHPETKKKITASIGRYGPYINHDGKFISLKDEDDVLTIGMNRAVNLIAEKGAAGGNEPLRVIGKHPDSNDDIAVYNGRFGPYVKHKKLNASLGRSYTPEDITLEQALELLEKQAAKKKAKSGKK